MILWGMAFGVVAAAMAVSELFWRRVAVARSVVALVLAAAGGAASLLAATYVLRWL